MKRSYYIVFIIFVGFLLVIYVTISARKSITDLESAYLLQPVEQKVSERTWKEPGFKQINRHQEFIPTEHHLRFTNDGHLYAIDSNLMVVNKYNLEGNLIEVFGKGKGRGPGEFSAVNNFFIEPDTKNIWVFDPINNRVTIFNPLNQDNWKILDLPEIANGILPVNKSEYWLGSYFYTETRYKKYNFSGKILGQMEPIVDDPKLWSLVIQGDFNTTVDGSFVQAHWNTNNFIKYNSEGQVVFFRNPISLAALPVIIPYYATEDPNRVNAVDFSTWKQISSRLQLTENQIHIYISQRTANQQELEWYPGFFDVYNMVDGDYLYSYYPPAELQEFGLSNNHFAAILEESGELAIWEVENGW